MSYRLVAVFAVLASLIPNTALAQQTERYTFTRVAGYPGYGFEDGAGSQARFFYLSGIAVDTYGNVYVADGANQTIRKITPTGFTTTLAGLAHVSGTADGVGSKARFGFPNSVAVDRSGNVYVAEYSAIRKITPAGVVTTLAGDPRVDGHVDGSGTAARFLNLTAVAVTPDGNIYAAENSSCIRKITPAGVVTTLSASGFSGFSLASDSAGNLYVPTEGLYVEKLAPDGTVSTVGSPCPSRKLTVDSHNALYVVCSNAPKVCKRAADGSVVYCAGNTLFGIDDGTSSEAKFGQLAGITADGDGNAYVADRLAGTIRKIAPNGAVTTLAGFPDPGFATPGDDTAFRPRDGIGESASFLGPAAIVIDSHGMLYVNDAGRLLRKITPDGVVTTIATNIQQRLLGIDHADNLYFVAQGALWQVSPNQTSKKIASISDAGDIVVGEDGTAYISSGYAIERITPSGQVSILAGVQNQFGWVDGVGSAARFTDSVRMTFGADGNLYASDHCTIRRVTLAGSVGTLVGNPADCSTVDGTGLDARLDARGLFGDRAGNILVAGHTAIRKVTPAMAVSTLAGPLGTPDFSWNRVRCEDGTGTTAGFGDAVDIVADEHWRLYVADGQCRCITIGRPAIADIATIDAKSAPAGAARQLDTAPATATQWKWEVIRRPVDSAAPLSSSSVRNPTFTPDVVGLFTFRLTATSSAGVSISTVDLDATVGATLTSSSSNSSVWQTVTFTAKVFGIAPRGTVTFFCDDYPISGTVTLAGNSATYTTSALTLGKHSMTARYNGDGVNAPAISPAIEQVVDGSTSTSVPVLSPYLLLLLAAAIAAVAARKIV